MHMEVSLVIGGDFNSVCDQLLARSKAPLPSDTQATAAMNEQQVQHAVSDFWCLIHLNKHEYTLYSSVHNSDIFCGK